MCNCAIIDSRLLKYNILGSSFASSWNMGFKDSCRKRRSSQDLYSSKFGGHHLFKWSDQSLDIKPYDYQYSKSPVFSDSCVQAPGIQIPTVLLSDICQASLLHIVTKVISIRQK